MLLTTLIKKAIRNATKEEADRIRKAIREGRVGEILPELVKLAERDGPLDVFYLSESRFVPVEEQDEVLNETEETVEEEDLEPVGESEEVVENDEYLGQHVVKRVFPETGERPRLRKRPF